MLRFMMLGCLTFTLLIAGGGYAAWRWWETGGKAQTTAEANKVIDSAIDSSGLSSDDKRRIRSRINATLDDFKTGKISVKDLGKVAQELADSPVLSAAAANGALADQLREGSTTVQDPKKRAEAQRTLERFIRAIMEQKIDAQRVQEITASLRETSAGGGTRTKEKVTPEDVEKVLSGMKQAADEAKVPDERFQVDYVAEVTKVIDRVLDKKNVK